VLICLVIQATLRDARQDDPKTAYRHVHELNRLRTESPGDTDLLRQTLSVYIFHIQKLPVSAPEVPTLGTRWPEDVAIACLRGMCFSPRLAANHNADTWIPLALQVTECKDLLRPAMSRICEWMQHLILMCTEDPRGDWEASAWRAVACTFGLFSDPGLLIPQVIEVVLPIWLSFARNDTIARAIQSAFDIHGSSYAPHVQMSALCTFAVDSNELTMDVAEPACIESVRARLAATQDAIVWGTIRHLKNELAARPFPWVEMRHSLWLLCTLLSSSQFSSHPDLVSEHTISLLVQIFHAMRLHKPPSTHLPILRFSVHLCTWYLECVFQRRDRARCIVLALKAGFLPALLDCSEWMRDEDASFSVLSTRVGTPEDRVMAINTIIIAHLVFYPVYSAMAVAVSQILDQMPNSQAAKQSLAQKMDPQLLTSLQSWSALYLQTSDADSKRKNSDPYRCHNSKVQKLSSPCRLIIDLRACFLVRKVSDHNSTSTMPGLRRGLLLLQNMPAHQLEGERAKSLCDM
jgi:hypothetical protein